MCTQAGTRACTSLLACILNLLERGRVVVAQMPADAGCLTVEPLMAHVQSLTFCQGAVTGLALPCLERC